MIMAKQTEITWLRYGRRFGPIRLSFNRILDREFIKAYDKRCELLGIQTDNAFLRDCLLAGFKTLVNEGALMQTLAVSTNESHNTQKQHEPEVEAVNGQGDVESQQEPPPSEPPESHTAETETTTPAIRANTVLKGIMSHA